MYLLKNLTKLLIKELIRLHENPLSMILYIGLIYFLLSSSEEFKNVYE